MHTNHHHQHPSDDSDSPLQQTQQSQVSPADRQNRFAAGASGVETPRSASQPARTGESFFSGFGQSQGGQQQTNYPQYASPTSPSSSSPWQGQLPPQRFPPMIRSSSIGVPGDAYSPTTTSSSTTSISIPAPRSASFSQHPHSFASAMRETSSSFLSTFEDDESEAALSAADSQEQNTYSQKQGDERYIPRGRAYLSDITRSRSQSLVTPARPAPIGSPIQGGGDNAGGGGNAWSTTQSGPLNIPSTAARYGYGEIKPPGSRYGSLGTLARSPVHMHESPPTGLHVGNGNGHRNGHAYNPASQYGGNGGGGGGGNGSGGGGGGGGNRQQPSAEISNISPFVRDVDQILLDDGGALRELWGAAIPPPFPPHTARDTEGNGPGSGTTSRRHSVSVVQPRRGVVGFSAPGDSSDYEGEEHGGVGGGGAQGFAHGSAHGGGMGGTIGQGGFGGVGGGEMGGGGGIGVGRGGGMGGGGGGLMISDDDLAADLDMMSLSSHFPSSSSSGFQSSSGFASGHNNNNNTTGSGAGIGIGGKASSMPVSQPSSLPIYAPLSSRGTHGHGHGHGHGNMLHADEASVSSVSSGGGGGGFLDSRFSPGGAGVGAGAGAGAGAGGMRSSFSGALGGGGLGASGGGGGGGEYARNVHSPSESGSGGSPRRAGSEDQGFDAGGMAAARNVNVNAAASARARLPELKTDFGAYGQGTTTTTTTQGGQMMNARFIPGQGFQYVPVQSIPEGRVSPNYSRGAYGQPLQPHQHQHQQGQQQMQSREQIQHQQPSLSPTSARIHQHQHQHQQQQQYSASSSAGLPLQGYPYSAQPHHQHHQQHTQHRRPSSPPPPSLSDLGKGVPLHAVPPSCPLYIVEFKAGRTDLFYGVDEHHSHSHSSSHNGAEGRRSPIRRGDLVIVEADRGRDLGKVVNDTITLAEVEAFQAQQMQRAAAAAGYYGGSGGGGGSGDYGPASPDGMGSAGGMGHVKKEIAPKRIYGKAQPHDTQLLVAKMQDEVKALQLCQTKVRQKKLPMEVIDAEYQWDRRKLTFYFVAEKRIDFRELVRELFRLYKTRIWMASLAGTGSAEA